MFCKVDIPKIFFNAGVLVELELMRPCMISSLDPTPLLTLSGRTQRTREISNRAVAPKSLAEGREALW
jgi:hypothetical protein